MNEYADKKCKYCKTKHRYSTDMCAGCKTSLGYIKRKYYKLLDNLDYTDECPVYFSARIAKHNIDCYDSYITLSENKIYELMSLDYISRIDGCKATHVRWINSLDSLENDINKYKQKRDELMAHLHRMYRKKDRWIKRKEEELRIEYDDMIMTEFLQNVIKRVSTAKKKKKKLSS